MKSCNDQCISQPILKLQLYCFICEAFESVNGKFVLLVCRIVTEIELTVMARAEPVPSHIQHIHRRNSTRLEFARQNPN